MSHVLESGAPVFDPFDPRIRADPYPAYRDVLAGPRVHRHPFGVWVLARHEDCERLLRSPHVSSDPGRSTLVQVYLQQDPETAAEAGRIRPFLFMDPPDHTRLRSLVQKAFTPRVVARRRARVQQLVDDALDTAIERGTFEVISELAYEVPVQVICDLLDVPREDEALFKDWSDAAARSLDPDLVLPAEVRASRDAAFAAFRQYMVDLIAQRRGSSSDDLLSGLVRVEEQGDVLSEDELVSTCILLLVAGHETTVNLIGNGVLAFCRNPDQYRRLRADPGLVRNAVEEVLRFDGPIQMTGRTVLSDIEVGEQVLRPGDMVFLLLAAANRDPAAFADPDRFDVTREPGPHLAFGHGIHYCLGAALARLEGNVVFDTLARRIGSLSLVHDTVEYKENYILRGVRELPVAVTAAPP